MQVMIRYRLEPDQVEENLRLLRSYFHELATTQPDGLRDAAFQLDDRVSFVHFVETDEKGPGPLTHLEEFQRYRATLDERCVEPPVLTVLHEVGAFGLR